MLAHLKMHITEHWSVVIAVGWVVVGYALRGDLSMSNVADTLSEAGYIVTTHTFVGNIRL